MKIIIIATILLTMFLASGCVGYGKQAETQTTTPETEPAQEPAQATPSLKEFTIHETSFEFNVPTITVKKGDTIRVTAVNDKGTHNLAFPDFKSRTVTKSSPNTQTIEFVADKAGEFAYYCEVNGHKALGMEGKLIVGEV